MAAENICVWILILLISLITESDAWDYCYYSYYRSGIQMVGHHYCSSSCCGYYYNSYCCTSSATIIGAVIGGIIFVACVTAIIICCLKAHTLKKGRVIRPNNSNSVTVVQAPPYHTLPNQHYYHLPGTQPSTTNPAYPAAPPPAYPGQTTATGVVMPPPYAGPPPSYN